MTKEQMQQVIDRQDQQIKELLSKIDKLESNGDEAIKESKLYRSLLHENRDLQEDVKFYKTAADSSHASYTQLRSQMGEKFNDKIRQILSDNQDLLLQHDSNYWIGITRSSDAQYLHKLEEENDRLTKDNARLTNRLAASESHVKRLQNQYTRLLYEFHPEDMPPIEAEPKKKAPTMGRPKAGSIGENIQARQLRKQGWSVREIASHMGWSVGLTQKTVASVKVDPEVVKQHRKENKTPRKKSTRTS